VKWGLWVALGVALVYPTLTAWIYFMALPGSEAEPSPTLQTTYALSKAGQFALPLICLLLFDRRLYFPGRPAARDVGLSLGFGLVVVVGMLLLYYSVWQGTPFFAEASARFRRELSQFNLASPAGFAINAVVITLVHSLLEEYYWRWFAFGWLTRLISPMFANLLSSAAFAAYHAVLLHGYFPEWILLAAFFGLCSGAGGVFWAWLYWRSGSIYPPWLSHLVVDAGLFVVGYDLFFVANTP
jgi:membrane protease YdiL (CAAX protease family)